jgi:hypothetical protein
MSRVREELNEDVYYGDGSVWVTSRRLVYGGEEHSLKGARGARMRTMTQAQQLNSMRAGMLLLLAMLALTWLGRPEPAPGEATFTGLVNTVNSILYVALACGVVFVLGALIVLPIIRSKHSSDPVFTVSIRFRFLSGTMAASLDRGYIERIVEAAQYAIAHRDGAAASLAHTPGGRTPEVPAPVVRGNIVYVGQEEYAIADIVSTRLSRLTGQMYYPFMISALILQQAFTVANKYFGQSSIVPTIAMIGEIFVVMPMIGIYAIGSLASFLNSVCAVQLNFTTGAKRLVFASTGLSEAKQVEQSIRQEMQGSYAVGQA